MKTILCILGLVAFSNAISLRDLFRRAQQPCKAGAQKCLEMQTMNAIMYLGSIESPADLDMDVVCSIAQPAAACVNHVAGTCRAERPEDKPHMRFLVGAVNYVCSAAGKATIIEVLRSPCTENTTLQSRMKD